MKIAIAFLATAALASPLMAAPIKAGKWEVRTVFTLLNMPEIPPHVRDAMTKPQTSTQCITQAEAEAGPKKLLEQKGADCAYSTFDMSGGKLVSKMQCKSTGMEMNSNGSMTQTSFNLTHDIKMNGPAGKMHLKASGVGKYIGAC